MADDTAPGTRRKAAALAADRVRTAILDGEIAPGSDLPGERELAEQLGVSRLTLRSALARLEAEGLVQPVHGSGTRVLDFREHGGIDLLGHMTERALRAGAVPLDVLRDLLELRRVVAVDVLGLVAERATDDERSHLRAHLRTQEGLINEPRAFMQADLGLARLFVRATHNLAIELLYNTVSRVIEQQAGLEIAFFANARQTLAVYGKLLDLIEAGDPSRVRKVAARLIDRLDRVTLERVSMLLGVASPEPEPKTASARRRAAPSPNPNPNPDPEVGGQP